MGINTDASTSTTFTLAGSFVFRLVKKSALATYTHHIFLRNVYVHVYWEVVYGRMRWDLGYNCSFFHFCVKLYMGIKVISEELNKRRTTRAEESFWASCLDLSLHCANVSIQICLLLKSWLFSHSSTENERAPAWVNVGLLQASVSACETVKQRMCLQFLSFHTLALGLVYLTGEKNNYPSSHVHVSETQLDTLYRRMQRFWIKPWIYGE